MLRDGLVMPSRRVLNVCKDFQSIKIAVTVKNGRYDFSTSGLKPSIVPLSDEKYTYPFWIICSKDCIPIGYFIRSIPYFGAKLVKKPHSCHTSFV